MSSFVWTGVVTSTWATGANWNVGGVSQAAPPTAADDVFLGTGTGATNNACTMTTSSSCRSIDCTGYTGTLTGAALTSLLIGNATAGAGNNALIFTSSMTFTPSGVTIAFISTSTTQQNVNFGGLTTAAVTFNGVAGSWKFTGAHTSTGLVTLTNGAIATNGQTLSWATFSANNTNTKVLDISNTTITITGSSNAWVINATGTTLISLGNVINLTDTSATNKSMNGGTGLVYNNLNWTSGGSGTINITTSNTWNDWIGIGAKTLTVTAGTTQTFTTPNNLTMTGSSGNVLTIVSGTPGTAYIFAKTTGQVSTDWLNIGDCQTDGNVAWFVGANSVVNSTAPNTWRNNSGITFTVPGPFWQRQMATGVGTTTAVATYPLTPLDNNFLVAFPTADVATASLSMSTSGYTKDVPGTWATSAKSLGFYTKIASSDTTTVTAAGTAAGNMTLVAAEYVGVATVSYLDKNNHADNQTASLTHLPGTTGTLSQVNEIVFFVDGMNSTGTLPNTVDSGFVVTARLVNTQTAVFMVAIVTATTALNPTLTITTNTRAYGAIIASYREAPASGGTLPFMGV